MNAPAVAQCQDDIDYPGTIEIHESAWIDGILTVEARLIRDHDIAELLTTLVDGADPLTRVLLKTDHSKLLYGDEPLLTQLSRTLNELHDRVLREVTA